MGRTLPSITQVLQTYEAELRPFRRLLRKSDQPQQIFLLAMLIEQRKEIMRLREELGQLAD